MSRILCLAVLILSLSASCAPVTSRPSIDPRLTANEAEKQRQLNLRESQGMVDRLSDVAWRLEEANADLCGERTAWRLGMTVASLDDVDTDWRPAYRAVLGVDDRITVVGTAPGSPAEQSGLVAGDRILSLNGQDMPPSKDLAKRFSKAGAAHLGQDSPGPMSFRVQRGNGTVEDVSVAPRRVCAMPASLQQNDQINAFADGRQIIVYTGLMRFAQKDEQLALIVGHEMAHDVMGHIQKKMGNRLLGALVDGLITGLTGISTGGAFANAAALSYSQEFEHEADYVGLYYVARAGFDISEAPDLWRSYGARNAETIGSGTTHPATAERFVALEADVKEIRDKQASGAPLAPEIKSK